MKKYNAPAMLCRTFEAENVITTSATQSSVDDVRHQMIADGVESKYIKVTSWNDMNELF
ncbi:MAG: hypothetical protein IJH94_02775 [Clostridia bacterium]|nr:hypothetical protein [Clostridia bacterium]